MRFTLNSFVATSGEAPATADAKASDPAGAVPLTPLTPAPAATARANASIWLDLIGRRWSALPPVTV